MFPNELYERLMRECDLSLEIGELSAAQDSVERALKCRPDDYRACLRLRFIQFLHQSRLEQLLAVGRYHLKAGRYLPARMLAVRAMQLRPFHTEVLELLQKTTESLERYRQGQLMAQGGRLMAERYCAEARAALFNGKLSDAFTLYRRAYVDRPFDAEAMEGCSYCDSLTWAGLPELLALGCYLFEVDRDAPKALLLYQAAMAKDHASKEAQLGYDTVHQVVLERSLRLE